MSRLREQLDLLAATRRWSYGDGASAAEPAAWAAMALTAHGSCEAACRPAQWLAHLQQQDGAVGISADEPTPCWPTSLAILAWSALERRGAEGRFVDPIRRAVRWSLANHGKTAPREESIGHDTTLLGWSWAENTHSWLEPTCLFVLALKAAGYRNHPRTREGIRLVLDRLLPRGGANYGNTIVLGQELLPHVQPTGLAMLTLAGEAIDDPRIGRSLIYLEKSLDAESSPISLSYGCLALHSHGRRPNATATWLEAAMDQRPAGRIYDLALLLLADQAAFDQPIFADARKAGLDLDQRAPLRETPP